MNAWAAVALAVWFGLAAASGVLWVTQLGGSRPLVVRPGWLALILGGEVSLTAIVAWLSAISGPLTAPWSWIAAGVGAIAAVLCGNAVVLSVFGLTDASAGPGTPRVQRTILRGGAWIGALERLAMLGTMLARWPEGIAAIVAVKAFARYPELRTGQGTGATERFIIGTFASLGWAAACAGIVMILL
ncbi:MAG TPA: hypothetical protein VGW74_06185 [Propionibacteriaceae bacterium]|nr:hypothetical protein [Propionibacteriaceae bacterium]